MMSSERKPWTPTRSKVIGMIGLVVFIVMTMLAILLGLGPVVSSAA